MENYETVMKDYFQKRAQSWIDNGCQYYWELRRVKPSSSDFSRIPNHENVEFRFSLIIELGEILGIDPHTRPVLSMHL